MPRSAIPAALCLSFLFHGPVPAAKPKAPAEPSAEKLAGLALRDLGPALTSGRVGDLAVSPADPDAWWVAAASGGVWKTANAGTTWTPVFDGQGSYSIGCLALDPRDPLTVWVGTGENNGQRSVGYGDGVYRTADGGRTWERMGLAAAEHIGKILIDPRDSKVVWVAAQGPLWSDGGDRGLYKTADAGKTWKRVLDLSEHTGVSDIAFDPRNPDVVYAAAWQRRRHVWTMIGGGPESGIHKTTDGGATWRKLSEGLPKVDLGRIGLAVAPAAPDTVYAIVEAEGKEGGFFRSQDAGSSWTKRGDFVSGSAMYYHELVPDPLRPERVYALDTWLHVTEDGGKSFVKVGEAAKHVDNHALWIDPQDTEHLLAGCDGGVYESHDRGATWRFFANLPITQFYRVHADNDRPFYNVYGGTQDNATLGGPSRTTSVNGITNADWRVTIFGDGFETQTDPSNPDIVYSQYQYGGLARFDRRSGELVDIQPQPGPGEAALRWNWDSPLLVSPHAPTRLYFAAQSVWRSDDRGDSWTPVSGDLTRQLDRNTLPVMGALQSVDAVAKHASTSFFGNVVSLAESPLAEGLLYAGTDDGLLQVTEDGGASWRRSAVFPGVPDGAYVRFLHAGQHDAGVVFAAFDDHKRGDFKPYLLRSDDRGRTWTGIQGNLPERGSVYAVVQDHEQPGLLFAGTEFGLYVTLDGGKVWTRLTGNMPTIAVRDLELQRRESDLVVATFGRGIRILDDYSPLRHLDAERLGREALLFAVRDAVQFMPAAPLGIPGKAFQGDAFFSAPNPPAGAVVTYYLRDEIKSRRDARRERERKDGVARETYPDWNELRREDREEPPAIVLTFRDDAGDVVRTLTGPVTAGLHRIAWDLRRSAPNPVELTPPTDRAPWDTPPLGPAVVPGTYTVTLARRVDGVVTPLAGPETFRALPAGLATLPAADRAELAAFQRRTAQLQRAVLGASRAAAEAASRLEHLAAALQDTPAADPALRVESRALAERLADLRSQLSGDPTVRRRNEPDPPSIQERVARIVDGHWSASSAPTRTQRDAQRIATDAFTPLLAELRRLIEVDLRAIEERAEAAGAPWTPGRVPRL